MWLLPWEDWLPPCILGPLIVLGSTWGLWHWRTSGWHLALLPFACCFGVWGTWRWFTARENVFATRGSATTDRSRGREAPDHSDPLDHDSKYGPDRHDPS